MWLEPEDYKNVITKVPILCVDGVIMKENHYVLVKRANEPLKGEWWVPGGRVELNETVGNAFRRKMKDELGVDVENINLMGYYEDQFPETPHGVPIHTVSVVFFAEVPWNAELKVNDESSEYQLSESLPDRFVQKMKIQK